MSKDRSKGRAKFLNKQRYFGFIDRKGGGEVFFHGSDVPEDRDLEEGEEASSLTQEDEGEVKAVKVRRVERIEEEWD